MMSDGGSQSSSAIIRISNSRITGGMHCKENGPIGDGIF